LGVLIRAKGGPDRPCQVMLENEDRSGEWETLKLHQSLHYVNHSPDGFSWGYGGSGPSQLAFAILQVALGPDRAMDVYQSFKWDTLAQADQDRKFEFTVDIERWLTALDQGDDEDRLATIKWSHGHVYPVVH